MKKIFIFFATVASVIFASCSKEYVAQDTPSTEKITRITASVPDTKTYLDGLQVKWSTGDKIRFVKKNGETPITYTLEGEGGSTVGTFVGTEEITPPMKAFSGNFCVNYPEGFYYDIPSTQPYVKNSIGSNLIPMWADVEGHEITFQHYGIVLRFDVAVAESLGSISLKSVKYIPSEATGWRFMRSLDFKKRVIFSYTTPSVGLSDLPATLTPAETTTFYFVVGTSTDNMTISSFTLEIKDTDNNTYSFYKESNTTVTWGKMYKFPAVTITTPDIKPFLIQKDGGALEPYYEEMDLSSVATSIKLIPNPAGTPVNLSANIVQSIKAGIAKNPNILSLDFSETSWESSGFEESCFRSFGDALGDLYLPSNIARLKLGKSGYGIFDYNKNLRLHIHEGLNTIDNAIIKVSYCKQNPGAGAYVDNKNTAFTSIDGVLFNKGVTKLVYFPEVETSYVIPETVTSLAPYSMSNNSTLTSVTVPSGIIGSSLSDALCYNNKFSEIIYKRAAATAADVNIVLPSSSVSPKYFRVPESSKSSYETALDGKLKGWTLEGYTE